MKNSILFLVTGFLFWSFLAKPKQFEGEVIYAIEYLKVPQEMKGVVDRLPDTMTFVAKDTRYKVINQMPDGKTQVNLVNKHDGTGFMLMNFLGHDIALSNDMDETHKENADYFSSIIEPIKDKKDVLGYSCKKAKITYEDESAEVYYTEKFLSPEYRYVNLEGMPLESVSSQNGMIIKATAVKLVERDVSEIEFVIPSSFQVMSKEELTELFEM